MQTIGKIIKSKTQVLEKNFIENPKQNVLHIVAHVLNCNVGELFLKENDMVTKLQHKKIKKFVNLRKKGVPFQYITKRVWFLDLLLKVNKNVLIPRGETEILTEMLINHINEKENNVIEKENNLKAESENSKLANGNNLKTASKTNTKQTKTNNNIDNANSKNNSLKNFKVLDLCCGSGAIGLSVAKSTNASVTLSDISKKAIKVAKHNAKTNNVVANFVKSDLFENITEKFNLIVSNPPYIKSADILTLQAEVKNHEPHIALDGGETGYDFYEKIIKQAPNYLLNKGELFLEIGVSQSVKIENLLKQNGFENIEKIKDYSNKIRFIKANLKGEL